MRSTHVSSGSLFSKDRLAISAATLETLPRRSREGRGDSSASHTDGPRIEMMEGYEPTWHTPSMNFLWCIPVNNREKGNVRSYGSCK